MIAEAAGDKKQPKMEIFYDEDESGFYGQCVGALLNREDIDPLIFAKGIVEFGSGNGRPIADGLRAVRSFTGKIRGIERDHFAYDAAQETIKTERLNNVYTVDWADFFGESSSGRERCVVGNPPYLPSRTGEIRIPGLWGGFDGGECAQRILNMNFDLVMIVVSSISNPIGVLRHAREQGYVVKDFMMRALPFGVYCRERVVWEQIQELRADGKAFADGHGYNIAGVIWIRNSMDACFDRSASLERALRSAVA